MKLLRGACVFALIPILVASTPLLFANDGGGAVECARLMNSTAPKCWWLSGYSYTFAIQNRFNGPVRSLSMAPDIPAGVTFNPSVIDVSRPLQYGQTRAFTITTANTQGASQACFRISLQGERSAEYGSLRVCVPLKRCWWDSHYELSLQGHRDPGSNVDKDEEEDGRHGGGVTEDPVSGLTPDRSSPSPRSPPGRTSRSRT